MFLNLTYRNIFKTQVIYYFVLYLAVELEQLERDGFGKLKQTKKPARIIFLKPPFIGDIYCHNECLKSAGLSQEQYLTVFKDISKTSQSRMSLCREEHPQSEVIFELFEKVMC